MSRPGSLARNVLSSWLGMPIVIGYTLVITPIVLGQLQEELYGVWQFLNGLLVYSELLYLGLGSAVVRFVAQARATDDHSGVSRLISVVLTIYTLIGLACFGIMAALSPSVPSWFAASTSSISSGIAAEPLSVEAARAAVTTCVLLGAQLLFVFIGSAFAGLISGYDRFDIVNIVSIGGVAVRFIAVPLFVRAGHDPLVMMAWLTSAAAGLQAIALAVIAFWYVPNLRVRLARPKLQELKFLYGFGLQSFFVTFAVKMITYTDTTVIGVKLGAPSVTLYSFPLQLAEQCRSIVGGFSGVLLPRLTLLVTQGDLAGLRDAYLSSTRIASFLSGWLVGGLICVGPVFLNRWVGPEIGAPAQWVLVYLGITAFAQALSSQAPFAFYQALHKVAFPAKVLMVEAVFNLGLSLWLAPRLGITGVALATAIPALFVSMVVLPPYLCRRLEVPLRTFVFQGVLPGGLMLVATLVTQWLLGLVITSGTYQAIIARGLLSVPVAFLIFLATFPADQQRAVRQWLRMRRATIPAP